MSGLSEEIRNEGIEKGRLEKRGDMISMMLNFGKMTLDDISKMMNISVADVQRYANQH